MRAGWKCFTMESGGPFAMMTSPSRLPKWSADSSASWTPSPGHPRPSTAEEKVRKKSCEIKLRVVVPPIEILEKTISRSSR